MDEENDVRLVRLKKLVDKEYHTTLTTQEKFDYLNLVNSLQSEGIEIPFGIEI